MKKLQILITSLVVMILCGCSTQESKFSESFLSFDTYIDVTVYANKEADANVYIEEAKELYENYNKLFNSFQSYEGINNVKTINDNAGSKPVIVDKDLYELIKKAKTYYNSGLKKNNIALAPVTIEYTNRYNAYEAGKKVSNPSTKVLKEKAKCVNVNNIILDDVKRSVFLKDKCNRLDVGATAKGYATGLVAQKLKDDGLQHGLINAGGNVVAINDKPDGSDYVIGVANPADPSTYNIKVSIKDTNVVTSGDYQRYYKVDGKVMHHLVDPDTLEPGRLHRSVTIVTPDGFDADYFSTEAFLSKESRIKELAKKYKFGYIIVDKDNKITVSDDLKNAVKVE